MKKLGIIGGIGPASTVDYYNGVIDGYMTKTGSDNYPEIIINSINMTKMISIIGNNDWNGLTEILLHAITVLDDAGADFVSIASNTPHIVFDEVSKRSALPLISIVDETCKYTKRMGFKKVLVIGTLFTMNSGMYTEAFKKYNVAANVPKEKEQAEIYSLFYPKLENGIVVPEDKEKMLILLHRVMKEERYDALVLGCTELPLMIKTDDIDTALINTTQIHIDSIINYLIDNPV